MPANYEQPKTCRVCGETEGKSLKETAEDEASSCFSEIVFKVNANQSISPEKSIEELAKKYPTNLLINNYKNFIDAYFWFQSYQTNNDQDSFGYFIRYLSLVDFTSDGQYNDFFNRFIDENLGQEKYSQLRESALSNESIIATHSRKKSITAQEANDVILDLVDLSDSVSESASVFESGTVCLDDIKESETKNQVKAKQIHEKYNEIREQAPPQQFSKAWEETLDSLSKAEKAFLILSHWDTNNDNDFDSEELTSVRNDFVNQAEIAMKQVINALEWGEKATESYNKAKNTDTSKNDNTSSEKASITHYQSVSTSDNQYWYAVTAAQNLVKDELKSPSTAKFPVGASEYSVERIGSSYKVIGYVDAQNSFGAEIRTRWAAFFNMGDTSGSKYKVSDYYVIFDE